MFSGTVTKNVNAAQSNAVNELRNLVATLSADYMQSSRSSSDSYLAFPSKISFSSPGRVARRHRVRSHLIFTMVSRSVSWMDRQNLERPSAAGGWVGQCVAVLHVGPRSSPRDLATDPLWFLLVPSLSVFLPDGLPPSDPLSHSTASVPRETVPPSLLNRASVERCVATTINDFHHRTSHHHRSSSKAPLMT